MGCYNKNTKGYVYDDNIEHYPFIEKSTLGLIIQKVTCLILAEI